MQTEFYTPFFDATCNVFSLMLDLSDIQERSADGFSCGDALTISIAVTGDLEGEVRYRFPNETSLKMVNIMSGMVMDEVDDFVTSAISEIANIISGNVLTTLAARDLRCDIHPPVVCIESEDDSCTTPQTECYMETTAGPVCLEIRLTPAGSTTW